MTLRIIVQKYGGSSLATAEKIRQVAARVAATHRTGAAVVVVTTSLGAVTEDLVALTSSFSPDDKLREIDTLLRSGKQITTSLLSMAIRDEDLKAVALGVPLVQDLSVGPPHSSTEVNSLLNRIHLELERGQVVVVSGDSVPLVIRGSRSPGQMGGDLTAVSLASALEADQCEIYSAVGGVYRADPRIVPEAQKISEISYSAMYALTHLGTGPMEARAIELARYSRVPIHARSLAGEAPGTRIFELKEARRAPEVVAVAGRNDLLLISTPRGARPALLERLLEATGAEPDILFDLPEAGRDRASLLVVGDAIEDRAYFAETLEREVPDIEAWADLGLVSVVGSELSTGGEVAGGLQRAARMIPVTGRFDAPASVSWTLRSEQVSDAVRSLHGDLIESYGEPLGRAVSGLGAADSVAEPTSEYGVESGGFMGAGKTSLPSRFLEEGNPEEVGLTDEIGLLYDELARLSSSAVTSKDPSLEQRIDVTWHRLRRLQRLEADRYEAAFKASLSLPIGAGSRLMAEAKALRDELEDTPASDPAT